VVPIRSQGQEIKKHFVVRFAFGFVVEVPALSEWTVLLAQIADAARQDIDVERAEPRQADVAEERLAKATPAAVDSGRATWTFRTSQGSP
jgi:hypothetical protein